MNTFTADDKNIHPATGSQTLPEQSTDNIKNAEYFLEVHEEETPDSYTGDIPENPRAMSSSSYDEEDPKTYPVAPFNISNNNEHVGLNSGSMSLDVTDFVLPGKNGFDLVLKRHYDSSMSNINDLTPKMEKKYQYDWKITFKMRVKGTSNNKTYYIDGWVNYTGVYKYVSAQAAKDAARDAWSNEWEYGEFEVGTELEVKIDGDYMWVEILQVYNLAFNSVSLGSNYVSLSDTRPNDHLQNKYGLGYGWGFGFPSIEVVGELYQRDRVKYYRFLHLGDGRSYRLDGNDIKDYKLKDLQYSTASGTIGDRSYHSVLTYKDGRKAYFQNENKNSVKLVAMADRFGSTMYFDLGSSGGNIKDTLGRTITLTRTAVAGGYSLTWNLPDGKKVVYTISDGCLVTVTNQEGQNTSYGYANYPNANWAEFYRRGRILRSFKDTEWGDNGVYIDYKPLTNIYHPTGAQTNYYYEFLELRGGPYNPCYGMLLLRERWELDNRNNENKISGWDYYLSWRESTGSLSIPYISNTTTKTYHVEGLTPVLDPLQEEYQFAYQQPANRHITRTNGTIVRDRSYPSFYQNLLPTKEVAKYIQGGNTITAESTWSYDDKGNLLSETLPRRGTVTMTYDGTYSLPLLRTARKDGSTEIQEEYTLRSDKKAVEWLRKYEKKGTARTLVEAVNYQYVPGTGCVSQERRYADLSGNAPQASAADQIIQFTWQDNAYLASKTITGLKNADGAALANIVEQYAYDTCGRKTQVTDARGNITKYTYNGLGQVTSETFHNGNVKRMAYTVQSGKNEITQTDERGNQKRIEYTCFGQLSRVFAGDVQLEGYSYDHLGRLTSESDYRKGSSQYTYDLLNRMATKTSGDYQERYSYHDAYDTARGLMRETKEIVGATDAPTITSWVLKDLAGDVWEECTGNAVTAYTYDELGNRLTEKNPLGVTTTWTVDYAGRATAETRPQDSGNATAYTVYNPLGSVVSATDFRGKKTTYTYDTAGRLLEETKDFAGTEKMVTRSYYDPCGNLTEQRVRSGGTMAAPAWRTTKYTYDARNRLVDTIFTDSGEKRTRNEYDACGNRTALYVGMAATSLDGAQKTTWQYDHMGNVTRMTDAIGNSASPGVAARRQENSTYTGGLLQTKADRNGATCTYTYDSQKRLIKESVSAQDYRSYTYHKNGLKATESNGELTTTFAYDSMGRLIRQTETSKNAPVFTVVKQYGYNACGLRTSFTMAKDGGQQIALTYTYDKQNRLKTVTRGGVQIAAYTYDANGNRLSVTHAQSGLTSTWAYNDAGLVTGVNNQKSGQARSQFTYSYAPDGNQTRKVSTVSGVTKTTDYTYDTMGRLAQELIQGGAVTVYTFDRYGNRGTMKETAAGKTNTTTYTYDQRNRLTKKVFAEADGSSSATTFSYDWNGNEILREWERTSPASRGTNKRGFTRNGFKEDVAIVEKRRYNGYGQLVYLRRDTEETTYAYRPDGLRHCKKVGNVTTAHIWDGADIVADTGINGGITARYLRGAGLIAREQDNVLQYYLHNAHGDVVQRTDQAGTVLRSYDLDAYGVERGSDANDVNPFRYCGEYFDRESGCTYLRARYYDAANGRFISEDPALDGRNWFAYCGGNPVGFVDPTGNFALTAAAVTFGGPALVEAGLMVLGGIGAIYAGYRISRRERTASDNLTVFPQKSTAGLATRGGLSTSLPYMARTAQHITEQMPYWQGMEGPLVERMPYMRESIRDHIIMGPGTIWKSLSDSIIWADDFESMLNLYDVDTNPYNWYSYELLLEHFEKHGHLFGAESTKDFARMSEEFYNNRNQYQIKIDKFGNIRVYDKELNIFGSYDIDGKAKTFFKPDDGQKYFNKQPGVIHKKG